MAKRKAANGELQSEKIIANVTPSLKQKFLALVKIKGTNSNELLTALIENEISLNEKKIADLIQLDSDYKKKFSAILAQDLGSDSNDTN